MEKELTEFKRLNEDLDRLEKIGKGWDGFSAESPDHGAIKRTRNFLSKFAEDYLKYCCVFPSNDGSIYIQGKFPQGNFCSYIQEDLISAVVVSDGGSRWSTVLKDENDEDRVRELMDKIITNLIQIKGPATISDIITPEIAKMMKRFPLYKVESSHGDYYLYHKDHPQKKINIGEWIYQLLLKLEGK